MKSTFFIIFYLDFHLEAIYLIHDFCFIMIVTILIITIIGAISTTNIFISVNGIANLIMIRHGMMGGSF